MGTQQGARPAVVIRAGDLDVHAAPDFAARLRQDTWARAGTVVLDLSDTEFLDEDGIEMIIAAAGQAAASGCRFGLVCTWWPLLRMLRAAGLTQTLHIAASIDDLTLPASARPRPPLPAALARGTDDAS